MALSPTHREAIMNLIGSDLFARLKNKPTLLKQVLDLFSEGQATGASTDAIEKAIARYTANPTGEGLEKQRKFLVCDGLDLPLDALNSDFDAKELLDLAAGISSGGGEWQVVMNDPATWNTIRSKGKRAGQDEVVKNVVGKSFGVPPGSLTRLTLDQVLHGAVFAQQRGMDAVIGKPGFWEDFGKGGSPNELADKWGRVLEAEERVQREKDARELREISRRIIERMRQQALEAQRLREQRREDRRRREAAEKRRRARRRRRRRRANAPKGRVILGAPELVYVIEKKSVNFSDGTRWDITWYSSGTQSIRVTEADGSVYFWKGRIELQQISSNPHTPFVRRVRRTMQEWRRPAQSSQQAAGPIGREG